MLQVFYPINLDRWRFPVSSSLRELTLRNPQIDFYSFSSPASEEDEKLSPSLWSQPHIHAISNLDVLRKRFDIIHHASATTRNLAAVGLAKVRSLGQCVHIFTAPIQPHRDDQYYRQYVLSVRQSDVLAAVSHAVADDIYAQFGRKVDAVIPSGVDLNFFTPEAATAIVPSDWGIDKPYVLFVGILTPRKRPDLFMNLAASLPELDFVMVGGFYTSEEEAKYRQAAAAHPNVKLLGAVPRATVRDLMNQAVALVFPSELEGLPLTVLEAAAMGLPILAQPKTSMPEAVIEDVTGWMFPDTDLSLWTQKLQDIQGWSSDKRQAFGEGARSFVSQHYSWDVIAQQYAELYHRVAQAHR